MIFKKTNSVRFHDTMGEPQCGVYGIKYVHRKVSELIKFGTIGGTICISIWC